MELSELITRLVQVGPWLPIRGIPIEISWWSAPKSWWWLYLVLRSIWLVLRVCYLSFVINHKPSFDQGLNISQDGHGGTSSMLLAVGGPFPSHPLLLGFLEWLQIHEFLDVVLARLPIAMAAYKAIKMTYCMGIKGTWCVAQSDSCSW